MASFRDPAPPAFSPLRGFGGDGKTPSGTNRRIPMKLTDTQLVILSAASQRKDGGIEHAPNLKGTAAHKVVGKLLTEGLIEEIQARGSLPVWRRDDDKGPLALRITRARPCGHWGRRRRRAGEGRGTPRHRARGRSRA